MWVPKVIISCILTLFGLSATAASMTDFDLSTQKERLVIQVYDQNGQQLSNFSAKQVWTLNGEEQELQFVGGRALFPAEKTIKGLVYLKSAANQHLFYLQKEANTVDMYSIPLWTLWLIPIIIIILVSILRKLIILAAFVLFLVFLMMNGLDVSTVFSLFSDGFKALFSFIA